MIDEEKKPVETGEENQQEEPKITPPDPEKIRSALAEGGEYELPDIEKEEPEGDPPDKQEDPETKEPEGDEVPKEPTTPPVKGEKEEAPTLRTSALWEKVKSEFEQQFGEGSFEMPELTPENEYEVFMNFVSKNVEPDLTDIPDMAKEIIELNKSGEFDAEKYFEQKKLETQDVTKLPDKDFLFQLYKSRDGKSEKNPDGFTDDEIEEHLEKKTKIELRDMAQSARKNITEIREQKRIDYEKTSQQNYEKNFEALEVKRKERAEKIVNQFQNQNTFFGIEFTPEEKTKADKEFFEMVALNKETRTTKIGQLLNDDNILYSIVALLSKGDLSGYLTDLKEGVKENIEGKLDRTLEKDKGSTKIAKPVDRSKLV